MGFTTYRDACAAAHELCFRIDDDVVVIHNDPSAAEMPPGRDRWRVEPRAIGARLRGVGDVEDHKALVCALVRCSKPGATPGITSIFHDDTHDLCDFCGGDGRIVTLGGYRPCGRCGGTGVQSC